MKMEFNNSTLGFSAQDANIEVPDDQIPEGVVTLRLDRINESNKEGIAFTDPAGDEKVWAVFTADEVEPEFGVPGGELLQGFYLDSESCSSNKAAKKLAMTRKFIGQFMEACEYPGKVDEVEDLIGAKAKAVIKHVKGTKPKDGEYPVFVNVDKWVPLDTPLGHYTNGGGEGGSELTAADDNHPF